MDSAGGADAGADADASVDTNADGIPPRAPDDEDLVECGLCGFTGTHQKVWEHVDGEHARVPVFECQDCGYAFWTEKLLEVHIRTVHERFHLPTRACTRCSFLGPSTESLNDHTRKHHSPTQPIFCRFCGILVMGREACDEHTREAHPDVFLECEDEACTAYFRTRDELEKHMKRSHDLHSSATPVPAFSPSALTPVTEDKSNTGSDIPAAQVDCMEAQQSRQTAQTPNGPRAPQAAQITPAPEAAQAPHGPQGQNVTPEEAAKAMLGGKAEEKSGVNRADALSLFRNAGGKVPSSFVWNSVVSQCGNFVVCAVCGLRHESFDALSDHMAACHKSRSAEPCRIKLNPTIGELVAVDQSQLRPKSNSEAVFSLDKSNQTRWDTGLIGKLWEFMNEKGFTEEAVIQFRSDFAPERSLTAVRKKACSLGIPRKRSSLGSLKRLRREGTASGSEESQGIQVSPTSRRHKKHSSLSSEDGESEDDDDDDDESKDDGNGNMERTGSEFGGSTAIASAPADTSHDGFDNSDVRQASRIVSTGSIFEDPHLVLHTGTASFSGSSRFVAPPSSSNKARRVQVLTATAAADSLPVVAPGPRGDVVQQHLDIPDTTYVAGSLPAVAPRSGGDAARRLQVPGVAAPTGFLSLVAPWPYGDEARRVQVPGSTAAVDPVSFVASSFCGDDALQRAQFPGVVPLVGSPQLVAPRSYGSEVDRVRVSGSATVADSILYGAPVLRGGQGLQRTQVPEAILGAQSHPSVVPQSNGDEVHPMQVIGPSALDGPLASIALPVAAASSSSSEAQHVLSPGTVGNIGFVGMVNQLHSNANRSGVDFQTLPVVSIATVASPGPSLSFGGHAPHEHAQGFAEAFASDMRFVPGVHQDARARLSVAGAVQYPQVPVVRDGPRANMSDVQVNSDGRLPAPLGSEVNGGALRNDGGSDAQK